MQNEYLEQVQQEAVEVERQLKKKKRVAPARGGLAPSAAPGGGGAPRDEGSGAAALGVRVTGWWPFKSVVVPPNVYVVHTRRGHPKPLNVGLGVSFRFDPFRDSFLCVPSAMQTIQISARSICKELQGILIQAYVQWIIDDIEVAYRRLDFSDLDDPMRVVNVQLREQAEAAIKDKVATLSIHEVLSDKKPIIEELTRRLKDVAEGAGDDGGLGIRIVTVQIKEAVVSSTRLWEDLQAPFRAEQRTSARMAEIASEEKIAARERDERQVRERADLEVQADLDRLRDAQDAATRERKMQHEIDGYQKEIEQVAARAAKDLEAKEAHYKVVAKEVEEQARIEAHQQEAELARRRAELEVENQQAEVRLEHEARRQQVAATTTDAQVRLAAVAALPEVARSLPTPEHLYSYGFGADGSSLAGLAAQVANLLRGLGGATAGDASGAAPLAVADPAPASVEAQEAGDPS